jgi:hypothetical protein
MNPLVIHAALTPVLAPMLADHSLELAGAVCDLGTGKVSSTAAGSDQ